MINLFRSISWRLQFSYGLLALFALIGLGIIAYQYQKSELLRSVDEQLQFQSKRINSMLVRHDLDRLRVTSRDDPESIPPLPPLPVPRSEIQEDALSYRVWKSEQGSLRPVFQSPEFPVLAGPVPLPRDIPANGILTTDASRRQMLTRAVRSYVILVSADLKSQHAQLNRFLVRMILGEALFFGAFVLAGYWLTKRAISPIDRISKTARKIADGKLDRRISIEGGSSELEQLSLVLNESFDRLEQGILRERQFTANASHELKTPIAAILSQGQSKPETIDEFRGSLDQCVGYARSMGQLVDQLLELARFDSGNFDPRRELTDLDLLVGQSIQMVLAKAEKKDIRIESALDLVQAELNPVGISQIVNNLLDNAVCYTEKGGIIRVSLHETENSIELKVEDNGIGIEAEEMPKIFERFYRSDQSRSGHEGYHFGLGLAISREIAAIHGGDLKVKSEPGKGSVFILRLPK